MKFIWCMIPEICHMADRIFLILDHFLPFYPEKEASKFWKNEKNTWRYHHYTQVYHKWRSYDIWFLRYEMQNNFFVILCHFLPFYPPPPPPPPISPKNKNIKNIKKIKKHLEISPFYTSAPKIMIIGYTVPEIWHMTDVIVIFHFGLFFFFYPPNCLKNENFEKMKNIPGDIIILYNCT